MERARGSRRTPLDDVDHLARSPHRAEVVRRFAAADRTRRELHEETGIPQPTLGRILGSFQERGWLERAGDTYALTVRGRLVATAFERLLDVVGTVQRLPAEATFEPLLELGFDLDWLAGVEVTDPAGTGDPFAHVRRVRESMTATARIVELSPRPMPGVAELLADRLRAGELAVETVFPSDAFRAFVADSDNRTLVAGMLGTGRFRLHLFDGRVPCYVARHGDRAVVDLQSSDGRMLGLLSTADPAVLDWVDAVVEDFRARSAAVTAVDLED